MKDIKDYEGLYAVTEDGKVWSYEKICNLGRNGATVCRGGFWLKPQSGRKNHMKVFLSKNGKRKQMQIHRLVALAFIPNPHGLPFVNHKDGNPLNNNVFNLEWCDAKQNAKHAFDCGLVNVPDQTGAKNSNAKLNDETVRAIRLEYQEAKNCSKIARNYGLNPKTINQIVNRKSWQHI